MRIHRNIDVSKFLSSMKKSKDIFQIRSKEVEEQRRILEMSKQQLENMALGNKLERIARKISRGDRVNNEERALLGKHNPEKLRKADMASKRRKELESRLKSAKNEKEARDIIMEASVEVGQVLSNKDNEYGELLSDAYDKAIHEYHSGISKESGKSNMEAIIEHRNTKRKLDIKI
ncbi:hypothetical protein [Alkaliphilus oremlandii]|uniref:Uncharacterized protein n=1 Tax=Alkaliphilus oremlandii (strain OhILAs) TaxID=350688 RepID=A8MM12_ALKOO|nr:hypothetical protein [Alkaliphilus oremlandii]ABW18179.1 hypothetical protein Clos_0619 [Alkaliphilus oremlandii OhILAs]